jgi:glutaminyl-peptide cyclotransferase
VSVRRALVLPILAAALAGCDRAPPAIEHPALDPASFSESNALREVREIVNLGPRDAGTPGAERAAIHLLNRLQLHGVSARLDVFTNLTPRGDTVFRNVVGEVRGTGPLTVILGSHYDTKSGIDGFEGANDSGSSCGVLLELARTIAAGPAPGASFQFVFFDGEECMVSYGPNDGLHGSRHHVERLVRRGKATSVWALILLDMVGDRDLSVTLPRNCSPFLLHAVLQSAHEESARHLFALHPFSVGDDHVPFIEAGIPAVDIIDFAYGSAPDLNDYWHTPADTMDKISAESLGVVGRVTLRTINRLLAEPPAK